VTALTGRLAADDIPYVVLRVHDRHYLSVETDPKSGIFVPNLSSLDVRQDGDLIAELFARCCPGGLHVNSFAGTDWEAQRILISLIGRSGRSYEFVCHDYSCVSHHYTLVAPSGIYQGLPSRDDLRLWWRSRSPGSLDACDPDERLATFGRFLAEARRVVTPSEAARNVVSSYFPALDIVVVPHPDNLPPVAVLARRPRDGRKRIAVIGALNFHKGSQLLLDIAADVVNRDLAIDLTVVGYTDLDRKLREKDVTVTGAYSDVREAIDRIRELAPDLVLIPSICAETYCFVLSLAIHLGLPPVAFALGAQGERIAALGWGHLLDPWLINAPAEVADALARLPVGRLWDSRNVVRAH
jgi:glycosyltransferase involved in cell wall biosynthesis